MITIAVDIMSGDYGPDSTVPASVRALSFMPDISLVLVGEGKIIQQHLMRLGKVDSERIRIVETTQVVTMAEKPVSALRNKKDSSLYRSIQLLQHGEVQACVSAGNTGALLAIGCHLLGTFEGIDRPAICASIPTQDGRTFLLDVGANVDVHAENLHQFAVMGSVLATALLGLERPRIGLLNIGVEDVKGNEQVREAARILQNDLALNYSGFVEADMLFSGQVDIAVCDGFVGNVALKSGEGAARLVSAEIRKLFSGSILRSAAGWLVKPLLSTLRVQINPARYNGASFLGLTATLVKSHGGADADAFLRAIEVARSEAQAEIPRLIDEQLKSW